MTSVGGCPRASVGLCERVALVPALVAGGGGMEGSGGLTCLQSRETKVNLKLLVLSYFSHLLVLGVDSSHDLLSAANLSARRVCFFF